MLCPLTSSFLSDIGFKADLLTGMGVPGAHMQCIKGQGFGAEVGGTWLPL